MILVVPLELKLPISVGCRLLFLACLQLHRLVNQGMNRHFMSIIDPYQFGVPFSETTSSEINLLSQELGSAWAVLQGDHGKDNCVPHREPLAHGQAGMRTG